MTPAPPGATLIPGDTYQYEHPNWAPILALVGAELTGWFMWMCEIRLDDGTAVHAFKHRDTRRYCHLALDGQAYVYVAAPTPPGAEFEPGSYRAITREAAIEGAFRGWAMPFLSIVERGAMAREIDHARALARRGDEFPVDPAELELQRKFEEEQRDKAA